MHVVIECRCNSAKEVLQIECALNKAYGKDFFHSRTDKNLHCWKCEFIVDNTTITSIMDVLKGCSFSHINCYTGE